LLADPTFANWTAANDLTNWAEINGTVNDYVEEVPGTGVRLLFTTSAPGFNISATPSTGNATTELGRIYRYRIVIDAISGTLSLRSGGGSGQFNILSSAGTVNATFKCAAPGGITLYRDSVISDMTISYFQVWEVLL
jgi:hypothetical protein